MAEPRLKAGLWVKAALRACAAQGLTATLLRHGDDDAGAVLIKQNLLGGGFRVLVQVRDGAGRAVWMAGTGDSAVDESAADAYVTRQVGRDRDLWVVEIESRDGQLPFDAPML